MITDLLPEDWLVLRRVSKGSQVVDYIKNVEYPWVPKAQHIVLRM